MIAYAAIDLRAGRAVQLIGGRPERERLSLPDPAGVAGRLAGVGFRALHVVDLDGALGSGSNRDAMLRILAAVNIPVQIGGGIRRGADVAAWLEAGAARVVVGTRAVADPGWLAALAASFAGRVVVAADVRGDRVVSHGWTHRTDLRITDLLDRVQGLPLAGLLVTDVSREGRLAGVDIARFRRLAALTSLPLIAAGGIRSLNDLRELAAAGIAGAVVGTALYTGDVDPVAVAREFAS